VTWTINYRALTLVDDVQLEPSRQALVQCDDPEVGTDVVFRDEAAGERHGQVGVHVRSLRDSGDCQDQAARQAVTRDFQPRQGVDLGCEPVLRCQPHASMEPGSGRREHRTRDVLFNLRFLASSCGGSVEASRAMVRADARWPSSGHADASAVETGGDERLKQKATFRTVHVRA